MKIKKKLLAGVLFLAALTFSSCTLKTTDVSPSETPTGETGEYSTWEGSYEERSFPEDLKASEGLEYSSFPDGICYVSGIGTCKDEIVVIPSMSPHGDIVIGIASEAFKGCRKMIWAVVPDSVTFIGNNAFLDCVDLEGITLPTALVNIGSNAFEGTDFISNPGCASGGVIYMSNHVIGHETSLPEKVVLRKGTVAVCKDAFKGTEIVSVTLPESLDYIGDNAFAQCSGLSQVILHENSTLERIGTGVFGGTSFFENSENRTDGVLYLGKNLIDAGEVSGGFTVKNGIEVIAGDAFSLQTGLTSISFPDSLRCIGKSAFFGCSALENVKFNDGLTVICENAFDGTALTSAVFPDSIREIGSGAFRGSALTEVTVPKHIDWVESGVFAGCVSLEKMTVPQGVQKIRGSAFYGCTKLKEINIPKSVWRIDGLAFYGCTSIKNLVLTEGIQSLGSNAFAHCSLESISLPKSIAAIESDAFSGNPELSKISVDEECKRFVSKGNCLIELAGARIYVGCNNSVIPSDGSVKIIGAGAFFGREKIKDLVLPEGITKVEEDAFASCTGLESVSLPKSLTNVGTNPFRNCVNLKSITVSKDNTRFSCEGNCLVKLSDKLLITGCRTSIIPEGAVIRIGESAFEGAEVTSLVFHDGITEIGDAAFASCTRLSSVSFPDGVKKVGSGAFVGCSSLRSAVFGRGELTIGKNAFKNCTTLENITIGDGANAIGESAFENCTVLRMLILPKNPISIGAYAFKNCAFIDDEANYTDGMLYVGMHLFKVKKTEAEEITLQEGTLSISAEAFKDLFDLVTVRIPGSVGCIGDNAFYGCKKLKNITYGGSMTSWREIVKLTDWDYLTGYYTVRCTDGSIKKR